MVIGHSSSAVGPPKVLGSRRRRIEENAGFDRARSRSGPVWPISQGGTARSGEGKAVQLVTRSEGNVIYELEIYTTGPLTITTIGEG
jgi:hypothetical protein